MSAAVMRREQLDVLVVFAAFNLVLDAVIGEVHLAIEMGQVVLARPVADLARRTRADRSIERQTSALLARIALVGLSVKTPRQCVRGEIQESAASPGRVAAAVSAWSVGNLLGTADGDRAWFRPWYISTAMAGSRPRTAYGCIRL